VSEREREKRVFVLSKQQDEIRVKIPEKIHLNFTGEINVSISKFINIEVYPGYSLLKSLIIPRFIKIEVYPGYSLLKA
jgi:hypothetical protein